MSRLRLLTIGEILWDVFPNAEHLGGAPFNFSAHAARLGHEVRFVSAVGDDDRGRRALAEARDLGLDTRLIDTVAGAPTGYVTVTVDGAGQPSYVIHRPAAYDLADLTATALDELAAWRPDWLAFGTLHQMDPGARALTRRLAEACPAARRFYDVNLRRDSFTPALVAALLAEAHVVKLNDEEVVELGRMLALPAASPLEFCRSNAERFGWDAVCVTRGAAGSTVLAGDRTAEVPGVAVTVVDTVGAGDAFAAAFLHGLNAGWPAAKVGEFANRVGAFVASRAGATPRGIPAA